MAQESEHCPRALMRNTWNKGEKYVYETKMVTSTVKFSPFQKEQIERMIAMGLFTTKAECIRAAVNDLIIKFSGVIDENETILQ